MNNKNLPSKPEKLHPSHLEEKAPPPVNPSIASVGLSPKLSKKNPFNKKTWLIVSLIFFALISIAGGIYLIQQRTKIKPKAAPEDVPSCTGQTTIRCWGECQPDTCREYEVCEIEGGFCRKRKISDNSIRCGPNCGNGDSGVGGEPATCSPEAPGQENSWCTSRHSGETKENATWSCEPNSPDSGNDGCLQICKPGYTWETPGYSRCIESEATSGRLTCRRDSNTAITLINTTNQSIAYEVIEFRGCSYNAEKCQEDQYKTKYVQPTVLSGQSKTESMNSAYCETTQLDVKSLNSNFPCMTPEGQVWDGGVAFTIDHHWDSSCEPTPTGVPPTSTPVPTNTPAPTYSCECSGIKLYDQNWNEIQPINVTAGQTIYISTFGQEDFPTYTIDKGRIKVNKTTWDVGDETRQTVPNHPNEFYITYTVPVSGGNIKIEGEIHLTGPETEGHWQ